MTYSTQSGRQDSNLRPPGPKPGALPACATSRIQKTDRSVSKWVAKVGFSPFQPKKFRQ